MSFKIELGIFLLKFEKKLNKIVKLSFTSIVILFLFFFNEVENIDNMRARAKVSVCDSYKLYK